MDGVVHAGEGVLWPGGGAVWIPIGCSFIFLSDFRDFSNFGYNFRRIAKSYYL